MFITTAVIDWAFICIVNLDIKTSLKLLLMALIVRIVVVEVIYNGAYAKAN